MTDTLHPPLAFVWGRLEQIRVTVRVTVQGCKLRSPFDGEVERLLEAD